MRVAVVINMIHPYYNPMFERLAAKHGIDLLVVYETAREENRQWQADRSLPFEHVVLDSLSLNISRLAVGSGIRFVSDLYLHLPRHPLRSLVDFAPDAVVAASGAAWWSPAHLAALAARRWRRWAFVPRWESYNRSQPTLPRRLAEPWVRRYFRSGDAWLAVGRRSARDLVGFGADPARVFTWPIVPLPPTPVTEPELPRSASRRRFLFAGQLIERKGVRILIEAFRQLPSDAELWIAGDGPLCDEVAGVAAIDTRIRFFGSLERAALDRLYAACDVFVLPSLYETWGVVVNEALEHGLPVVVTAGVGAGADIVEENGNGRVVAPGSADELRDAMADVAAWPVERRRLAAEVSRRKLRHWTLEHAVEGIIRACAAGVAYCAQHRRMSESRAAPE